MKTPALVLILALAAGPALAFDPADRAAVEARVAAYEADIAEGRLGEAFTAMPPALLHMLADALGVTPEVLTGAMREQIEGMMVGVTITAFDMDAENMVTGDTGAGQPYAFIPTVTKVSAGTGDVVVTETQTLALMDGGAWYLVRIENQEHFDMIRTAYPGFRSINLP